MSKTASIIAATVFLAASPVAAQYSDIGGANLDAAGSIAGTMAMNSYLDDDDDKGRSARPVRSRRQAIATTCTKYLPVYRSRYGSNHPQVRKLAGMCRRDGF